MPRRLDLTFQGFGRLWVLNAVGKSSGGILWLCQCECGTKTVVRLGSLRSGVVQSCGCLHREISSENGRTLGAANRTHGHALPGAKSRTYRSWESMRRRCWDPTNISYRYYGGRGVRICDRWEKFENFLADMGERPEGLTLDRVDNEGNYEPGNCRWSTPKEQAGNRRPPRVAA